MFLEVVITFVTSSFNIQAEQPPLLALDRQVSFHKKLRFLAGVSVCIGCVGDVQCVLL